MCGIVGFTGQPNPALLQRMADTITYRGPDDAGFFSNGKVNFGHRRLSIIDLSSGHQPMSTPDKKQTIIFNGEIYNYKELQKNLTTSYSFVTTSDTEVLLALYKNKGVDGLRELNGMFAFALWDEEYGRLLLARDRMGKKPLYYTEQGGELYFASEPKALLQAMTKKEINEEALRLYFLFQYIPGSQSIFKSIKKLLPGYYLLWEQGKAFIGPYWQRSFSHDGKPSLEKFGELLSDAVKIRLVSDVPLGIFLSGGIDSSTVAYYAVQHSREQIKTFSIGFKESSYDESRYAHEVAKALRTDHHHKIFSAAELLDVVPTIFQLLDEPLADASILPTFLLSTFTRGHVTVALGGDGTDELLAGYQTVIADRYADWYRFTPHFMDAIIRIAVGLLPVSDSYFSLDFKLTQVLKGVRMNGFWRHIAWIGAFSLQEQEELFTDAFRSQSKSRHTRKSIETIFTSSYNDDRAIANFFQTGYLVDDILTKVDRASMYNSLEVRAPFLDYRVVEHLNSLPYRYKLRGLTTKYLLRQLMKDILPASVVTRPKQGFSIPLSQWLRSELRDMMEETLSERAVASVGMLNVGYVKRLVSEHLAQKKNHRMKLWTLISFMQWYKHWHSV